MSEIKLVRELLDIQMDIEDESIRARLCEAISMASEMENEYDRGYCDGIEKSLATIKEVLMKG